MKMLKCCALVLALLCGVVPALAADMEITPFRITNQSPLIQVFGLPSESAPTVAPKGRLRLGLTMDVASSYTASGSSSEQVLLDGESYRWTLSAYYGLTDRIEAGLEIPYVLYGGGFLDGFIIDWHRAFGLSQGGRDNAAKGRLLYSYQKNGVQKLRMSHADSGIGDISLNGGLKLYDTSNETSRDRVVLRAGLKLPTGDSNGLRGSGGVDFSLSLCGSMNGFTEWGSLGVFASLGGMAMTTGDVLHDQRNNVAGFGTFGLGWGPAEWISFKAQLNAHTPFYHGSSLDEISSGSLVLIVGGALRFPGNYLLDIGVSEDVLVSTAPDVGFHFGLSKQF